MGSSTRSDVVPFVVHGIITNWDRLSRGTLCEICGDLDTGKDENPQVCGWTAVTNMGTYGKRNRLYTTIWEKNGHEIHFVNESEYAAVSEVWMSVCADTKEALELFLTDFEKPLKEHLGRDYKKAIKIEECDSVTQTL